MDIRIDSNGKIGRSSITSFNFHVDSTISLKYDFTISMTNLDNFLISLFESGNRVKIYVGRENNEFLIGEGDIVNIEVSTINDVKVLKATFQNHAFKMLSTTYVEDKILSGEPIQALSALINVSGIKSFINLHRSENVKIVANGYLYNVLRRLSRERGILWNVSGDSVYIGNTLSTRKHYFNKANIVSFFTSFINTNGLLFKKHDISMQFNSSISPGDALYIDKNSYIVGRVVHRFTYESRRDVIVKTTKVYAFEKIENAFWYAEVMDSPFHDVDHMLDDRMIKQAYDVEGSRVSFKDIERNAWLGDNEKITFARGAVGAAQMYLNIGSLTCAAAIGAYIPYNSIITDVRITISTIDVAYLEIMRNGVLVERFYCNALLKYEKTNLKVGPGIFSVRYTPGVGAAGIASVVCEINYRKVNPI